MTDHRHWHGLSAGTHTVEMAQLADITARLAEVPGPTAAELGLDGAPVPSGRALPAAAVLRRVWWSGDPTFPDIMAAFDDGSAPGSTLLVVLHTAALRALSHHLGLRQTWGIG